MEKKHSVVFVAALCATAVFGVQAQSRLPMVPQPREWKPSGGEAARVDPAKATYAIKEDDALGAEGYALAIAADGSVAATAPTEQGLFWARRTVDQLAAAKSPVPAGSMRDWPKYRVRGVMLDVGRKFVRMETLRALLKDLAHYKMNEFHVHLNDDGAPQFTGPDGYSAFRLECETHPGLAAKDGHYTKAEFRAFMKEAAAMGVTVIPEIDSPAHSGCFIKCKPGLDGKYGRTHLALDKPEVRDFMEKLFAEYLDGPDPVFAGKYVHVGTDEYDKREAENFRAYTDWAFRMVRRHGHEPRAWGSLDHAAGKTPVLADRDVVMDIWHNPYYDPVHALDAGYSIVAIPDFNLYVVPAAGYYFDYLDTKSIFETWEPCVIAGRTVDANHPRLLGGKFAIWNDLTGNGISEDDVIDRFLHAVPAIAEKTWTGALPGLDWKTFAAIAARTGEAPGVNLQDRASGPDGAAGANDRAIGWSGKGAWRVSFGLRFEPAPRDRVLFDDGTSQVVLRKDGAIGFARDGYDWFADRPLPAGKDLAVEFFGTKEGVKVSADGAPIGDTRGRTRLCRDWGGKMKSYRVVRTLHFPLAEAHHPGATVKNLEAREACADAADPAK
ncbi:MAG: family 20 glycosylhydrolase [Kiritimatiellae bacterium]|nr:family 20 glycosylhydrolase [Kiritimatiellia bacterium]